ncbi:MAG: hypothetical protein GY749_43965 [Desulfobacteraceae bacterium]|nr:hypothetical protein [Desulfobacteraceae bacterium]
MKRVLTFIFILTVIYSVSFADAETITFDISKRVGENNTYNIILSISDDNGKI